MKIQLVVGMLLSTFAQAKYFWGSKCDVTNLEQNFNVTAYMG